MGETSKAHARRLASGFFAKYTDGRLVIDIGAGVDGTNNPLDLVCPHAWAWDTNSGDATFMASVQDGFFDTVYSSHLIEHLVDPVTAVKNWWRILKPGGHLIISAPSRDHYEKRKTLPSRWNSDHKFFVTLDWSEPPCSFALFDMVNGALGGAFNLLTYQLETTGHTVTDPEVHSDGEYSIELVLRKPVSTP